MSDKSKGRKVGEGALGRFAVGGANELSKALSPYQDSPIAQSTEQNMWFGSPSQAETPEPGRSSLADRVASIELEREGPEPDDPDLGR